MTCGWPPAPTGGSVTPANIGSVLVTGLNPPFGIHHALSPVFMLYAVTPPISFGLTIDTPPMTTSRPELRRVAQATPHRRRVRRRRRATHRRRRHRRCSRRAPLARSRRHRQPRRRRRTRTTTARRPPPDGVYPGGGGSAPICPHASCGELYGTPSTDPSAPDRAHAACAPT